MPSEKNGTSSARYGKPILADGIPRLLGSIAILVDGMPCLSDGAPFHGVLYGAWGYDVGWGGYGFLVPVAWL